MKFTSLLLCLLLPAISSAFTLESSSFLKNKTMPEKFVFNGMGCSGQNASPALEWKNAPKETRSFIITAYDPDAPTGSGWWHWTVFNIPADTTKIAEGASGHAELLPKGAIEGRTDFGRSGYGGACPPPGDKPHRYIFTVYALKVEKIDVSADSPAAMVGFYANANSLAKATLTVKYKR